MRRQHVHGLRVEFAGDGFALYHDTAASVYPIETHDGFDSLTSTRLLPSSVVGGFCASMSYLVPPNVPTRTLATRK